MNSSTVSFFSESALSLVIFVNLLTYFSASQSPSNGLTLCFLVIVSFPATTLSFSHSSFLFLTFVFSPWDFYSLGQKNNNNSFVAVDVLISETLVPYGCCETFSRATFTLSIHRNPLYFIMRVVVPCCLLSFVAVLTFFLQPSRTERLAIG